MQWDLYTYHRRPSGFTGKTRVTTTDTWQELRDALSRSLCSRRIARLIRKCMHGQFARALARLPLPYEKDSGVNVQCRWVMTAACSLSSQLALRVEICFDQSTQTIVQAFLPLLELDLLVAIVIASLQGRDGILFRQAE